MGKKNKVGRNKKESSKRLQPTFSEKQIQLIRRFKGVLGEDDGEIVRAIVTNWLLEKCEDITKIK